MYSVPIAKYLSTPPASKTSFTMPPKKDANATNSETIFLVQAEEDKVLQAVVIADLV